LIGLAVRPTQLRRFANKMDAVKSAFTRVFDALLPAHDEAGSHDPQADDSLVFVELAACERGAGEPC